MHAHSVFFNRFRTQVHQIVSRLQPRNPEGATSARRKRAIQGLIFVMASVLLGWLSYQMSRKMTLVEFQESHSLPPTVWRGLLERAHHRQRINPEELSRVIAEVSSISRHTSIPTYYQSENRCWTWFPAGTLSETAELWGLGSLPSENLRWQLRGFSLMGLEKLATTLDTCLPSAPPIRERKPKSIDPKEFHY